MSIRSVLLLTVLLHLAFAGSRVTLSLFALHLQATPLGPEEVRPGAQALR